MPPLILRSAWPHRAPGLAAAVWLALTISFTLAVTLAASQLAAPTEHLHAGLIGMLPACGIGGTGTPAPNPTTADRLALGMPLAVFGAFVGAFLWQLARAALVRARHRDRLDKVAVHCGRLRATVLTHGTPAAYCLPGFRSRVVVSDAAVRLLTEQQLGAVLEHERDPCTPGLQPCRAGHPAPCRGQPLRPEHARVRYERRDPGGRRSQPRWPHA